MKKMTIIFSLLALSGCTSVSTKMPSDSTSVTIRHGTVASMSDVQKEADTYCSGYSKRAYFRARYNENNATFDCR
jgi:uncharacterized protein YceK